MASLSEQSTYPPGGLGIVLQRLLPSYGICQKLSIALRRGCGGRQRVLWPDAAVSVPPANAPWCLGGSPRCCAPGWHPHFLQSTRASNFNGIQFCGGWQVEVSTCHPGHGLGTMLRDRPGGEISQDPFPRAPSPDYPVRSSDGVVHGTPLAAMK
jgi:hypothetical protein